MVKSYLNCKCPEFEISFAFKTFALWKVLTRENLRVGEMGGSPSVVMVYMSCVSLFTIVISSCFMKNNEKPCSLVHGVLRHQNSRLLTPPNDQSLRI